MAFRKFLSALGVNAPEVETVVDTPAVRPGERLDCTVTVRGGGADVDVERLRLDLVVRAEDREADGSTAWRNPYPVAVRDLGAFRLPAGETLIRKVSFEVPWEMPLTRARGIALRGAHAAVRTELAVDGAVDKGDFDRVEVHGLPAHDALFDAFEELGFALHETEVKIGEWTAVMEDRRTSPWWQEVDFFFPAAYGRGRTELEAVFVPRPDAVDVHPGGYPPLTLAYAELDQAGWTAAVDACVRRHWR
ncbi:hypothetical protein C6N75_22530 [Streptomyces solincola]|uniref:Sporulation protein n=1 Tax=Streptomyces solincola TaxID=2100817 RepID=A0A2S9PRH5_9ACTN|nr:sporulation protein [Streptomyces solincola]PRH77019.1 hypothetical protein C6N75_22530 [Streptomyces solincola]